MRTQRKGMGCLNQKHSRKAYSWYRAGAASANGAMPVGPILLLRRSRWVRAILPQKQTQNKKVSQHVRCVRDQSESVLGRDGSRQRSRPGITRAERVPFEREQCDPRPSCEEELGECCSSCCKDLASAEVERDDIFALRESGT